MKKFLALALVLILVMALATPASAANGTVVYNGHAKDFFFYPGTEESPTDLFPDLKDVMPGDSLHQRIFVVNNTSGGVNAKLYMRARGAHKGSEEFLSQMTMTITQMPGAVIYEAPADQTAQLTDWVYLGMLHTGGSVELDLRLDVSAEMGNDFQEQAGYLDWEFYVEDLSPPPGDPRPDPPQTGDNMNLALYIGLMAGAAVLIVVLLLLGRKKKKEESR